MSCVKARLSEVKDITPLMSQIMELEMSCFPRYFDTERDYLKYASNPKIHIARAMSADKLVGLVVYGVRTGGAAYIYSLAVSKQHRGCGVGKRLLKYALSKSGVPVCTLHVDVDNPSAFGLYERCGFTVMRTYKNYRKSGKNMYYMRRSS